jgi:two-component system invasion response regulator UvrY
MIKVLLVDDHAAVRVRFKLLLQANPEMKVVAEAPSGAEAFRKYVGLLPDVVIMDIAIPGIGGLEPLCRLLARYPKVRVLALSAHDDPGVASQALEQGALGFLLKSTAPGTLIDAVAAVAQGCRYLDPLLAQKLALAEFEDDSPPVEGLSEREFDVFVRFAGGATVKQIARDLRLPAPSIGTHLRDVTRKLGVMNQSDLTLIARSHGLIEWRAKWSPRQVRLP